MKTYPIKNLKIFFLLLVAVIWWWTTPLAQAAKITPENVVELVNQARSQEKLPPLVINEKLVRAAMDKAADMLTHDYFAHTSPQGVTPWDWISQNKYNYKYAGENLAMGFAKAEDEQQAWMKSPTHRQNILNPHYQEIGVAVTQGKIDGQVTTIAVQEFGSRLDFVASTPQATETAAEPAMKKGEVLGEEQVPEKGAIGSGVFSGFVKTIGAGAKNISVKISKLDWNKVVGAGATGSLGLAAIGSLLIAGYLAVDSLVIEYVAGRQRSKEKLLPLATLSPEEYLESLKNLSIDASKLQIIYLQQMKPRK